MKKSILIVSLLLFIISLHCVEELDQVKKNLTISNLNTSLGLTFGGSLGFGKIEQRKKTVDELTANIQYKTNEDFYMVGIFGQLNTFKNRNRTGFFRQLTGGIDYTKGEENPFCFNPGGPNEDDCKRRKFRGIFPNLTLGYGYSFKISQRSRLQISIDIGLKRDIASFNIGASF